MTSRFRRRYRGRSPRPGVYLVGPHGCSVLTVSGASDQDSPAHAALRYAISTASQREDGDRLLVFERAWNAELDESSELVGDYIIQVIAADGPSFRAIPVH